MASSPSGSLHTAPCRCCNCLQGDRRAPELRGLSLLGVTQIDRVAEAVEETLKGHTVQLLAKKALPRLDLPKVRCTGAALTRRLYDVRLCNIRAVSSTAV